MTKQEENKIDYDVNAYIQKLKGCAEYEEMTPGEKKKQVIKDFLFYAFRCAYSTNKAENNADLSCRTVCRLFKKINGGEL